jgi:hypothetical protein
MVVCDNIIVTLDAGAGADTYLWSTGAVTQTINVDTSGIGQGIKTVSVVTTLDGCQSRDTIILTFINCTGIEDDLINSSLRAEVFPNPNDGAFTISVHGIKGLKFQITLSDISGKVIHEDVIIANQSITNKEFNLKLPVGVYLLKLENESTLVRKTIVIKSQ